MNKKIRKKIMFLTGRFDFQVTNSRNMISSKLFMLVVCCFLPVPVFQYEIPNCDFDFCHDYDSAWWRRHAIYCYRCSSDKIYHCARDYDDPDTFREGCAVAINCSAGHEPHLSFVKSGKEIKEPIVHCRICRDGDYYNDRNRPSSTFSECPHKKLNDCSEVRHKIPCKKEDSRDERYCRCDARKGYHPVNDESFERCSYNNYDCRNYTCPESANGQPQERLLNYTCAPYCQKGYERRREDSDDCLPISTIETTIFSTTKSSIKPDVNTSTVINVSVVVPSKIPVKDCAIPCDKHSFCENGTCVCLNTSTCPSLYKPVCGYDLKSDVYKTYSTECELFRNLCREKKFLLKYNGRCEEDEKSKSEKGVDKKWVMAIAIGGGALILLVFYGIHKSCVGKKIRERYWQYAADLDMEVRVEASEVLTGGSAMDGNTSKHNEESRTQLNRNPIANNGQPAANLVDRQTSTRSAPLSEPEDTSTPSLIRRDSQPIIIHQKQFFFQGPVIKSRGKVTRISIKEESNSKQKGNMKEQYKKEDTHHGENEQLLYGFESDHGDLGEQNIPEYVHHPKPMDNDIILDNNRETVNSETDDRLKGTDEYERKDEHKNNDMRTSEHEKVDEHKNKLTSKESDEKKDCNEISITNGSGDFFEVGKHEADGVGKQVNEQLSSEKGVFVKRRFSVSHESLLQTPAINDVKPLLNDMDKYKILTDKVMDRCSRFLVNNMDPKSILICFTEREMFEYTSRRDIVDLTTTTEKSEKIIAMVRQTGDFNYNKFKECLRDTGQYDCLGKIERVQHDVLSEIQQKNLKLGYKLSRLNSDSVPDIFSKSDTQTPDNTNSSSEAELPEYQETTRKGAVPMSPESELKNLSKVGPTVVPSQTIEEMERKDIAQLFEVEEKSKRYLNELSEFIMIDKEGKRITRDERFEMFVKMCGEMKMFIPELTAKLLLPNRLVNHLPQQMFYKNTPEGFQAYNSSGKDNSCLYQSVSLLLCGSEELQYSLRLLATLHAVTSFDVYKKQLLCLGNDLKLVFAHHINDTNLEEISKLGDDATIIDACLKVLMMETAFLGTDSSVLHVVFLCGALGSNIEQHFQSNTEYGNILKEVSWIKHFYGETVDVTLPDLHIFWVNYEDNEDILEELQPMNRNKMKEVLKIAKK